MKKEKELIKNTFIITVGKICTQLITFLLLPLYTSILSTEEYGLVDLITTLSTLFLPIITFQVEQAIFRELIDSRENIENKKIIISNGIISVFVQCLIFFIIYISVCPLIKNDYKYLLLINIISYIFVSLLQQIARGLGDNISYSVGSFISAFSTILFNLLFLLVFKMGATGMITANIIGQVISIIYFIISDKIYLNISFSNVKMEVIKRLWKYSFPLIPNQLSWWIFNVSDRVIVSIMLGLAYNGILSAANKFSGVYIMLYNIFNISWTESISLHMFDNDIEDFFNKTFKMIISIFTSIGICIIAVMPFIFDLLINEAFKFGYNLIPILVLASMLNVIVGLLSAIYIANKKTIEVAKTSVISAIINIIVHLVLIKFVGLYAAAISTLVSFAIMSVYRIYDVNKNYIKLNINYKNIILSSIIIGIIIIIYYTNIVQLYILGLVISAMYCIIMNRNILITLVNKLKERNKRNDKKNTEKNKTSSKVETLHRDK